MNFDISDHFPVLCCITNSEGRPLWYNEEWYEYTGATEEQMMASGGWGFCQDPINLPKVLTEWQNCVANSKIFEMVYPLRSKEGIWKMFLNRAYPRYENNILTSWFGILIDVSRKYVADEKLFDSYKENGVIMNELVKRIDQKIQEMK